MRLFSGYTLKYLYNASPNKGIFPYKVPLLSPLDISRVIANHVKAPLVKAVSSLIKNSFGPPEARKLIFIRAATPSVA